MKGNYFKILAVLFIGLAVVASLLPYIKTDELTVTVTKVYSETKVTQSGSESGFDTEINYYVSTTAGQFQIDRKGILYCKDFGSIQEGKKYIITVRGIRADVVGIYPYIVSAKQVDDGITNQLQISE